MPPLDFGTAWRHVGTHRRYGNSMELWHCPDAPQAWHDAYKLARESMVSAGYSWSDRGSDDGTLLPCWWNLGKPIDVDALRAEVDRVVAEAAARSDAQARASAERLAREVAEVAPVAALIRGHLGTLIAERPWSLGRHLSEARELAASTDWTRYGLTCADRYLSNARGNIERANERLGRVPPAVWFAKAADPAIRAAALQACRVLSERDEDWAAVRNSQGWSQATTWTGHVLTERESLDQGEAGHALGILHGHRRQLPDALQLSLFGEVYTRRRARPAAAAAPTLAL